MNEFTIGYAPPPEWDGRIWMCPICIEFRYTRKGVIIHGLRAHDRLIVHKEDLGTQQVNPVPVQCQSSQMWVDFQTIPTVGLFN